MKHGAKPNGAPNRNAKPMNLEKPDQLLERLAAMHADFTEWDEAFPVIGQAANHLQQIMKLHIQAGNQIAQRAAADKDIDAQVASLREAFRAYEPVLRGLAMNSLRVAELARRIHGKLNQLNEPLT